LEEHRKIGENIIKSETTDVSIQAGGGATVDKPIVEVDRLGGGNTRYDSENSMHIPIREQVSDSVDERLHVNMKPINFLQRIQKQNLNVNYKK
jgi:hypothetical protein